MDAEQHDLPPELLGQTAALLESIDDLPVAEHSGVYSRVHSHLLDALADTDGPGTGAGPA